MNYVNDSDAPFCGPACWLLPSFSDSLQAGFSASVLTSLHRFRAVFTSPAIRPVRILWSSVRKEQRHPSPSAVNIALPELPPMVEHLFSTPPLHFPATRYR